MSKEILETLVRLFALLSRQDGGVTQEEYDFVKDYLIAELNEELANEYVKRFRLAVVGFPFKGDKTSKGSTEQTDIDYISELEKYIEKNNKEGDFTYTAWETTQPNPYYHTEYLQKTILPIAEKIAESQFKLSTEKQVQGEIKVTESIKVNREVEKITKAQLDLYQKVLILVRIFELITIGGFSRSRKGVIEAVADYFKLKSEYKDLGAFVLSKSSKELKYHNPDTGTDEDLKEAGEILVASAQSSDNPLHKNLIFDVFQGELIFKYVIVTNDELNKQGNNNGDENTIATKRNKLKSEGIFFVKYLGKGENLKRNGFPMRSGVVYQFPAGSTIRSGKGISLYFNEVNEFFMESLKGTKLSFTAQDIEYRFPNGAIGVQPMTLSYPQGRLVGIMGGSGAGKTTLMNVLSGIENPYLGNVYINGMDVHNDTDKIDGVVGFIAQDDLLLEDLTVYQNLYYNAKLCLAQLKENEVHERVIDTLDSLGLEHIKDIKVGNVLNKKISGGQRKRLNIALELIREPAVMFVDEPTSGLSSKDSQNVVDLLKELALRGKLIFVVIHQPSADIYKTFDEMIILDRGGYLAFQGNPIEAIKYFKRETNQADADKEHDNPEEMFKIIEKEVYDDYGRETGKRQFAPIDWNRRFKQKFQIKEVTSITEQPPSSLHRPNVFRQSILFTVRDFLSKVSNLQYMLINLLEAPVLAVLLAFIIRFQNEPKTENYVFRYNDNIPAYILICIIISLFMGLTVSAEEIIKDRKIQKREKFLNLSRFGYLSSKIVILFMLSAIQTFSFVVIGNGILGIEGELLSYWGILFAVSCFANVLGLNISSTFNSVITIYITIPLLLIPQLILSGIIFRYEKMNHAISEKGKVPLLADIMVSRWAFEAISVDHFMHNKFQKDFQELDAEISRDQFKVKFWVPELKNRVSRSVDNREKSDKNDSIKKVLKKDLDLIRNEIKVEKAYLNLLKDVDLDKKMTVESFDTPTADNLNVYLDSLSNKYQNRINESDKDKEKMPDLIRKGRNKNYNLNKQKDTYFNDGLSGFVRNAEVKDMIIEHKGKLLQQVDPIFLEPKISSNPIDYRTHFMAPKKHFFGKLFDTYWFNMSIVWAFTFILYLTLYFDAIKGIGGLFQKIFLTFYKILPKFKSKKS
ncbi:MAG: ATP-binding cassette domain-containing protein [Cytophagia bacterium]|nr:MAG: ATP-binding cassette domain-containing protein [Cytophagia bacterium]TAG43687.1 MAG: ATP-binding cassette domain-containing protein [Cytophagia bacterium]